MIYTSYFNQPKIRNMEYVNKISIARGKPKYLSDSYKTYPDLMPEYNVIKSYKEGKITSKQFTEYYMEDVLSKLDPKTTYEELDGKVLLCHCVGDDCHRHIVRVWLNHHGYPTREI